MQVVGVLTGAVVLVPVLSLLQAKYGIGEPTIEHPHPLSAPQATLMASLTRSVFGVGLPWPLVGLGAVIGVLVIVMDRQTGSARQRVPTPRPCRGAGDLSAAETLGHDFPRWHDRNFGKQRRHEKH